VRWREFDFRRPPARDIAWGHAKGVVSYPPSFVGNCHSVVTLYPALIMAGAATIGRDGPSSDFVIMPSEEELAAIARDDLFEPMGI